MQTHKDIYCMIYFPSVGSAFCMDRKYLPMFDGASARSMWGKVKVGDVVEVSNSFLPPQCPKWVDELKLKHHNHIALWLLK